MAKTTRDDDAVVDDTLSAAERAQRDAQAAEAVQGAAPYDEYLHPDGTPKTMVIARQNGGAAREITHEEWATNPAYFRAEPGAWRIIESQVVAQNHSDNVV